MSLSIKKLQSLLLEKGFAPTKYFIEDDRCIYIEIFSVTTTEIFLLYIPSKYTIPPPSSNSEPVFKLKYIDVEVDEEDVANEYAGDGKIGNYDTVDLPPDDKMEEHLENNYKQIISFKDITQEDAVQLRSIYRQIRRLRYSVQNINYKIGIIYENYICSVTRHNDVTCYIIKHYPRDKHSKNLLIIIDLETFYNRNNRIIDDMRIVREALYTVLERNLNMHIGIFERMLQNKKSIETLPNLVHAKKKEYDVMIAELEKMFTDVEEAEKKTTEELQKVNANQPQMSNLNMDINRAHSSSRLLTELGRLENIKNEITKNILVLRSKRENCILNVDKLLFDNTVMWDSIVKNFATLKEYV